MRKTRKISRLGRVYDYFGQGLGIVIGRFVAIISYILNIYAFGIAANPTLSHLIDFREYLIIGIAVGVPVVVVAGRMFYHPSFSVQGLINNPAWRLHFEGEVREFREKGWNDLADKLEEMMR